MDDELKWIKKGKDIFVTVPIVSIRHTYLYEGEYELPWASHIFRGDSS